MRSRHPAARVRNGTTQLADKSIERQQNRVRLAKSQTHRVMPYPSSLACDTWDGHLAVVLKEIEYGRTMDVRAGASTMSCESTDCCAFITCNLAERTDRWLAKTSSCSRGNPANTRSNPANTH